MELFISRENFLFILFFISLIVSVCYYIYKHYICIPDFLVNQFFFYSKDAINNVTYDNNHLYIINNKSISKHHKTGSFIQRYIYDFTIKYAIIVKNMLYCLSHINNYNIIYMIDTNNMKVTDKIYPRLDKLLSWITYYDNKWWAGSQHSNNYLIKLNNVFIPIKQWQMPSKYIHGGSWNNNILYLTDKHGNVQRFILREELIKYKKIIRTNITNGLSWDNNIMYGINKHKKYIHAMKLI